MGVPKFFRYISERYPCLSEMAREHCIPEFDNLYLDVNGIVHNCSHPDDGNIHFHLEEVQILQDIFNYIDKLFYLIKPQKLFFLAVDGVAPRAKMNQQRSRRFRSAREAEQQEAKALQRGEKREHERFDSNCITPGTEFMVRLQQGLRNFLRTKITTDPLWQKCRIILSGQETPGEGEHKIMDYIRFLKAQPNFDPNTRHCLYGLDADLIILGLCTHELHFVVLREEVKFGRNVKRVSVEETRFFLLHLGLLREYLELEFDQLSTADKKLDVAQLIDDWVLMGFMVGNDFIPHLPCLHISSNALPLLYKTYIRIYPSLGGNINEQGKLNLQRLQHFMTALSQLELELFTEHFDDLKYLNAKTEAFDFDVSELNNASVDDDLAALIDDSSKLYDNYSEEMWSDDDENMKQEFESYKRNYYRNKFKREMDDELTAQLGSDYVTALQWILDYYYRGVQSWNWYYPHHYSPFISDIKNIQDMRIKFDLGQPFLPFQQLLAVLPGASCKLLPTVYHDLMLLPSSPLAHFYPTEFECDLNGKKHDWEAVVLVPFIDEELLLKAMRPCEQHLSAEERARNSHGPMYQYDYSVESQGAMPAMPPLKPLSQVHCTERPKWASEIALSLPYSVFAELPNAARHVFFPGFPTMKHLAFVFEVRHERIKVFEQMSRNQNVILKPKKRELEDTLEAVAAQYLQQVVYIGWPHMIKAKVVRVATREQCVDEDGRRNNDVRQFDMECRSLKEHFSTRMGIQFDNYKVLVHVRTHVGSTVEFGPKGNVRTVDAWSSLITGYPAQGVVIHMKVHETVKQQLSKVEELLPVGTSVFFIGNPYYGSEGTVLDPQLVYTCGRVQVNITVRPEPVLREARLVQEERDADYFNSYDLCSQLGISPKCLGRITGTAWVLLGPQRPKMENVAKHNVGLQLKYPRQNEERIGYCRRQNNQWMYTSLAMELIRSYSERFPEVIKYFSNSNYRSEFIYEDDLYPWDMGQRRVEELAGWVRQQPHMKVDRVTCGSKTVCKETVELLLDAVEQLKALPVKDVKLQVKPHLLIKPNVTLPDVYKSRKPVRLFDRIVVVRTIYMVPVGVKGTVIGIYPVTDPNPVRLECVRAVDMFCEVLFDRCIPNCNDIHGIAEERVFKVPESALVVIFTNDKTQPHELTRTKPNAPETGRQEQQQPTSSRYMTAAGSDWIPITMKTDIPAEFYTPKVPVNWRASREPQQQSQSESQSQSQPQPQPQQRTQRQQRGQPARQQKGFAGSKERLQGGGAAAAPPPRSPQGVQSWRAAPATPPTPQAQTLALKSLLGLDMARPEAAPPTAAPDTAVPAVAANAPTSPMPQLPKPPLYWQQEAQQQQQRADSIRAQQWTSSNQTPQQPQPAPTPAPPPQQLGNRMINPEVEQQRATTSYYTRQQQQQQQPHHNNNAGNYRFGYQICSNVPYTQHLANNNRSQRQHSHHHYQPAQSSTARHSIQDFVPTQAYRPKISHYRLQTAAGAPNDAIEDNTPPAASVALSSNRNESDYNNQIMQLGIAGNTAQMTAPIDDSSVLMRALRIEPQQPREDAVALSAAAAATDVENRGVDEITAKNASYSQRKPRVPRIGAKFDLDYILP